MTLRTAKSIDALYTEIADYDIVLTDDAPLALALDNRVDRPRIGRLAATPRSYAVNEMFPNDLRPLFFSVIESTALSWKEAIRALEQTIDCWTTTGNREAILTYEEFDTEPVRTVVDLLGELDSSYRAVDDLTLSAETDIAVIDEHHLSALDRTLLPASDAYTAVSSVGDGELPFPELAIFPSATAIVSTIVDQIEPETADNFGIVLAEESSYSTLFESTLAAQDIPFSGGPGFEDDPDIRTFLRLLESTFGGSNQRLREIRAVLSAAGITVPSALADRRVDSLSRSQLGSYAEFRETAASGSFGDLIDTYEEIAQTTLSELRNELEQLELLDKSATEDRLTRFQYYLTAVSVPNETDSDDGVLLAGANSTASVDRPVVFYVGLGPEWAQRPPEYPWVDAEEFRKNDLARFERLLQNGEQRYYFVQETRAGSDVTPCVYLRRLVETAFESFDDLPHTSYRMATESSLASPFSAPAATAASATASSPTSTLSQSELNRLANCPRDAFFHRLVDTPTTLAMARGTLLHEAAEIYAANPSVIESNREAVLDGMCTLLNPYLRDANRGVERTTLAVGLEAITRYLDDYPPEPASYTTYDSRDRENELAAHLGVAYESPLTERWFASESVGLHGFIDLLQRPDAVVDYKTGQKHSSSELLAAAEIDPVANKPNFQAVAYLAKHREERPDQRLEINFVHVLSAVDAAVAGSPPPVDELVSTITYIPLTFSEFVASKDTFEQLTDFADSNARCKVLNTLGYERYREFFDRHELPQADEDPPRREAIIKQFTDLATSVVGDYNYVTTGCEKIFGDLESTPTGYVLEPELDAFENFVDDQLAALNTYRETRFPVAYRDDGPTWDRVDHRDLILTDR